MGACLPSQGLPRHGRPGRAKLEASADGAARPRRARQARPRGALGTPAPGHHRPLAQHTVTVQTTAGRVSALTQRGASYQLPKPSSSTASAPATPSMAQRQWITSDSWKRCREAGSLARPRGSKPKLLRRGRGGRGGARRGAVNRAVKGAVPGGASQRPLLQGAGGAAAARSRADAATLLQEPDEVTPRAIASARRRFAIPRCLPGQAVGQPLGGGGAGQPVAGARLGGGGGVVGGRVRGRALGSGSRICATLPTQQIPAPIGYFTIPCGDCAPRGRSSGP